MSELGGMIDDLIYEVTSDQTDRNLVDIITFCEDKNYLGFPYQIPAIEMWPMQKIVLKLFYRGSRGNEHLQLNEDEMQILKDISEKEELDYLPSCGGFKSSVIDKYYDFENKFTTLVLALGRRSSKTFMVSVMAVYEAYKLLESPGGNPQKKYNLPPDKEIAILNIAVSQDQAYRELYKEIESRIAHSPYFKDKISPATKKGDLRLLTDCDKAENANRKKNGVDILREGSIKLMCGHSNSASLRGPALKAFLADEIAHFKNSSGTSSQDQVYDAIQPAVQQFEDGIVVLLSDPEGKDCIFYRLFEMGQLKETADDGKEKFVHPSILSLQIPTWRMNPNKQFSREKLEREEKPKNQFTFYSKWGARFIGEAGSRMFDEIRFERCIDYKLKQVDRGNPKYFYYMHLDPATTSHNYALALVHPVRFMNQQGVIKKKVILDYMNFWTPGPSGPISIMEVENEIVSLCKRFNVRKVTFDSFQSAQTIERLRARGICAEETPFDLSYMTEAYGEAINLINSGDLIVFPHEQLIGQMKFLRKKILNRMIKREFDKTSEYPSDDCCDALVGAINQAIRGRTDPSLPKSTTVWMGPR